MTPLLIDLEAHPGGPWYAEYRRLRHRIFVVEQSWSGLSSEAEPGLTRRDPADAQARFWLARTLDRALIGAVRVCAAADVFPHEDLFERHLEIPEVAAIRPRMGTLNSLAVERRWRRQLFEEPDSHVGTAAALLLRACLSGSVDKGLQVIVATAQTIVSARAMMRAGFRVIDPPARTDLHPEFAMCNMGIVLRPADAAAHAVAKYFDERQRLVLGSQTIDRAWRSNAASLTSAAAP
jgi:N-acyl-L-homoserine lactone synthetase